MYLLENFCKGSGSVYSAGSLLPTLANPTVTVSFVLFLEPDQRHEASVRDPDRWPRGRARTHPVWDFLLRLPLLVRTGHGDPYRGYGGVPRLSKGQHVSISTPGTQACWSLEIALSLTLFSATLVPASPAVSGGTHTEKFLSPAQGAGSGSSLAVNVSSSWPSFGINTMKAVTTHYPAAQGA